MSKIYNSLKCSICGYIPDDEDIEMTNYKLYTCENCGKEGVCDLCMFKGMVNPNRKENIWGRVEEFYRCYSCYPLKIDKTGEPFLPGKNRKTYLADDYFLYKKRACKN